MMTQSAYTVVGATAVATIVGIVVIAVMAPASVAVITTLVGFVSVVVLQVVQLTSTKKVADDMEALEKNTNSKMDQMIEEIRTAATAKGVLQGRQQAKDEAASNV